MLLALRPHDHRLTEGLPAGPLKKIHCGRTEQERRLLLALPWWIALSIDATIHMNTHRASAAAPRPKGAAIEPTWWRKETHEATDLEPWRQAPALLIHLQKLAAVFTFLELEVEERLDDQATVTRKWPLTVERRWDGADPSIFRDYKFDDNIARDDVWDQEVFNSIWRRASVDRGSAFPNLLFFLVYAYLVEWENFENRPRPKFFSACARLPRWPCCRRRQVKQCTSCSTCRGSRHCHVSSQRRWPGCQAARTAKLSGLMSATLARATAIFCSRKKKRKKSLNIVTLPL